MKSPFTGKKPNTPTERATALLEDITRHQTVIRETETELETAKAGEVQARESLGSLEADAALGNAGDTAAARGELRSRRDDVEVVEIRLGSLRKRLALRVEELKALEPTLETTAGELLQKYEQAWDTRFRSKAAELKIVLQERWAIAQATHGQFPLTLLKADVPDPSQAMINLIGVYDGWQGCASAEKLFAQITEEMAPYDRAADVLKKIRAALAQ